MRREPLKFTFLGFAVLLVLVEGYLLLSGNRVLLNEEYHPEREATYGISFSVPAEEAKFECTYFTGRKRVYKSLSAYHFDECPFIWTQG